MSKPTEIERIRTLPKIARRKRDGHKGNYGRVLVIGGSRNMSGAVALAANASLRGGAGLVTFAAPETVQRTIASLCPCATSLPLCCDGNGRLDPKRSADQMLEAAEHSDAVAVGPGLAVGNEQTHLVRTILQQDKPVVLDADGLNNLLAINDWPKLRQCPLVLTPHPGEFARLTGEPAEAIQADREQKAVDAARAWAATSASPLVVVLKGAGTVVTDARQIYVNDTGNPGMATGGSGDVLTGLTAARVAMGCELLEATCLAVRCHGLAGDLAAGQRGEEGMIAWDLLDHLPAALQAMAAS